MCMLFHTRIFVLIDVSVTFTLININDVSEVEETIKTTAYLTLSWTDSELQWTPETFGNITEAFWPQVRLCFLAVLRDPSPKPLFYITCVYCR